MDQDWAARKRQRDDEVDPMMDGLASPTQHRNKRIQSLPLRMSPPHKRWSDPTNLSSESMAPTRLTPANSDSDEMGPAMDVDMGMMVDNGSYPLVDAANAGRMPTPMYPEFAAQVKGNMWASQRPTLPDLDEGFCEHRHTADASVPRSLPGAEWSIAQDRRLPSPISELGTEDAPMTPGMDWDDDSAPQRPYLPHAPDSIIPTGGMVLHPNIHTPQQHHTDMDAGMSDADGGSPSSAPASPSPRGKFGHCRSKHTLSSWTAGQPGMKKSFSIGYRADCEKCRLKIPGHFNHIIVS
ncbi:uncharacterized protein B0I36DRAFT_358077 [Microdochium trichocladiopsis]|uniref:Uncharacterized protein n=1 Tax=Microdochium trichocladiopsis TaxID=1682393 RepID=A0A9P9BWI4_9PEZI|nr:uncharacterized protein B0I36DRAFT_358077 [Microdochium trichocladiopsis]KAH7040827.1 hypothetical protein B0I36DRAFT_358077 [Microdochium trichocladiopsis]